MGECFKVPVDRRLCGIELDFKIPVEAHLDGEIKLEAVPDGKARPVQVLEEKP